MKIPQGFVLRFTAFGVAFALALSCSEVQAQTKTRTVNRQKFQSLVTKPLKTTAPKAKTSAQTVLRTNGAKTLASALPRNLIIRGQGVTNFTPLGFGGGGSGFIPLAGGPGTFGDPNPSPSE